MRLSFLSSTIVNFSHKREGEEGGGRREGRGEAGDTTHRDNNAVLRAK
jgi:hypothetical protein